MVAWGVQQPTATPAEGKGCAVCTCTFSRVALLACCYQGLTSHDLFCPSARPQGSPKVAPLLGHPRPRFVVVGRERGPCWPGTWHIAAHSRVTRRTLPKCKSFKLLTPGLAASNRHHFSHSTQRTKNAEEVVPIRLKKESIQRISGCASNEVDVAWWNFKGRCRRSGHENYPAKLQERWPNTFQVS